MFIKKIAHTNKKNGKTYHTYKLMESFRTPKGPRCRTILNLGAQFALPRKDRKLLVQRISELLKGEKTFSFFTYPPHVEELAYQYAHEIQLKQGAKPQDSTAPQKRTTHVEIDLESVENHMPRQVGGEYIIYEAIKELKLDTLFASLGWNKKQIAATIAVIVARLLCPDYERSTHWWLHHISSIHELLDIDLTKDLSEYRLYQAVDLLLSNKKQIESHLRNRTREIFHTDQRVLFYDLTNAFVESSGVYNNNAPFGRSKARRKQCRLLTLGLVLDPQGFVQWSSMTRGNVYEAHTLKELLNSLSPVPGQSLIVMDAGLSTEANLGLLREKGYYYVTVSRKKPLHVPDVDQANLIRDNGLRQVHLYRHNAHNDIEVFLSDFSSCQKHSSQSMPNRVEQLEQHFEEQLQGLKAGLSIKGRLKKYGPVMLRLGRLKERYKRVSYGYTIEVITDKQHEKVIDIIWQRQEVAHAEGWFCFRTNNQLLSDEEIYTLYTRLQDVKDSFLSMKSPLEVRPSCQRTERHCEAHINVTVLAYGILQIIRRKLRTAGIHDNWWRVRQTLSTHRRITTECNGRHDIRYIIRRATHPEPSHLQIYQALGLSPHIGNTVRTEFQK